ncbi:Zinc finger FYVE domain-containing protein 26 [Bagarius yarrelli]|uniref:Zinc finger FYVE domain-containing protein 26 n=1 Tax=Bagarius yarrelli TaxID=175774 RepID=A0A556V4X5_BAGYA|nr:Zinc finger FYVE domain-containing protein 26 [Bagarius yarrelli]
MHPFGREQESSVQDLFLFFTQCLQHAEWELAAACVRQLGQPAVKLPQPPDDIIRAIIAQPYQLAWETAGSPHRLAWFWLQVLEKHSKEKVSLSVHGELAFLLILEDLGEEVPHSVLKELHQAFLESECVKLKDSPSAPPLSAAALSSIRSLLSKRRLRLTHALLCSLKHTNAYSVYLQHLLDLVDEKESSRSKAWAEEVCGALALAPCAAAELDQVWAELWRARMGPLSEERVMGCLLRPQSYTLLLRYCATALRLNRDRMLQDSHAQVNLPESERLMLGLCCHGDRHAAWKAIYFECLSSGKHFLEQVLVTGLDLIKKMEFLKLKALLGMEFQPLSRLLLLLGWNHCQSLESAQNLLRILHQQQSISAQRSIVMFRGFCAMKYAIFAVCVNTHVSCSDFGLVQLPQKEQAEGYSTLFQHCLSECQLYLEAVPTMFRLELLENILSLLFLSYSDFTKPNHCSTEKKQSSGNEESGKRETLEAAGADVASAQLTPGCRGFLLDPSSMEGVLRLIREGLEGMCALGRALEAEAELAEYLGCSVTVETFSSRLQRLSKHTAEAQWRLQIVTTNQGSASGGLSLPSPGINPACSLRRSRSVSSVRKKKRSHRQRPERRLTSERLNGEISTSTSDNSSAVIPVCVEYETCVCGGPHSWLVPSMLSPPESLLISCIRRGNYVEAHQVPYALFSQRHVMLMFGLENAPCCGELFFMERYHEVLSELAQVEQKIESQGLSSLSSSTESLGSVGVSGQGRSRLGSSSRITLQSIGSAAAAGMAFYSIADVAERLLSSPSRPLTCLEENYWLSHPLSDPSDLLHPLLEELSPAGMAAFDLACCQCQLWKSSRQLLETAERRLHSSLESRGITLDQDIRHLEGVRGFPSVLQQISKILNRTTTSKGPPKSVEGGFMPPFGSSAQDVLLCSHSALTEEAIAAKLTLVQRLEVTLQTLTSASDMAGESQSASSVLASLLEQAGLKQSELDSHPVRSAMKQLLRSVDQLCPIEPDGTTCRPDYIRSFLDYINILASVLVRSLGSEDQSSAVKLGNPLLVLLQSPHQLLSHLLFDRQVTPDRLLSLLHQEGLRVNIQEVIVQRCCDSLPVWSPLSPKGAVADGGAFCPSTIASLLHQHAQEQTLPFDLSEPPTVSEPSSESEASVETSLSLNLSTSPPSPSSTLSSSSSTSSSSTSFLLTPSALSFLKSRSPLVAVLALLSVSRVEMTRVASSAWPGLPSYFRSAARKETPLEWEQISKEAEALLASFPILKAFLVDMAAPVLGSSLEAEDGVGAALSRRSGTVAMFFSGSQDLIGHVAVAEAFQQALIFRDLNRALSLLDLYAQNCSQKRTLQDRVLACTTLEVQCGKEQIFRVKDWELRARVVLQSLESLPLHSCLELLQFCLSESNPDHMLTLQLRQKKHELDMYNRLLSLQPPLEWQTWQEFKEESSRNPESMFSLLLQTREFDVCAQWVQLYSVSDQSKLQLQTEHLLHLLENGQTVEAFQLLEGLPDSLEVSERALDQRPGLAACHFLSDYLTLHFQSRMTPARRRHIHALHLGSKMLLTLPDASRQAYFQLLAEPLLMLEQLLMNLKVDWVAVAVSTLRTLLPAQEAGISHLDIDTLLAVYAKKALDFPYAPREWSRSDSVISLQDALLQCPVQDSAPPFSPSRTPPPSTGSTPMHTPSSSTHDQDRGSSGKKPRPSSMFTPPEKTPERKDWIPDHQRHICMVCQRERFTMFNRRHHCRRCGRLVCHACSSRKMVVEGSEEPVRVCDHLDEELEQAEVVFSPVSSEGTLDGVLCFPEVPQRVYRLSPNAVENQQLHSEFYYEQAPSASLCVSILTLHSDHVACGQQLIDHCCSISRKLTNPEVDARLLTDVMQQLVFSAKLMFVRAGRSQDLALCDSYISKVDVLKILVSANYKYIPSLDDILEMSAVTRLRNQLLEAEYYQLAVEVSTKSGLDPSGVWHAWGMALLKAGCLSAAREKFARCLKAPVDRNQLNLGSRLLQEVIQHLESTIRLMPSMTLNDNILASLTELEEALRDPTPVDRTDNRAPRCGHHQECVYYLMCYGTHLSLISFYLRHDCLKDALRYLLSKECPEEVFLEGILQRCLEKGRLVVLQGLLETLDPTLESWGRYLMAACQMLQRKGHYHTLYQLQQFMMDHVRAAMTCIHFFTRNAKSYVHLGEQQRWLARAKEHLKAFLQEQQNRRKTFSSSSSSSFRKKMSANDVSRHMNTIMLQLEVTRFLHRCESSPSTTRAATSPSPTGNSAPPTLFGGMPMKVDVACRVMLGGKTIEDGFGIAYRVIQDFQLDALSVYIRVGQRLVCLREYQAVRQLLKCVSVSGPTTKHDCDTIVLSCVSASDKNPADAKELEALILESKSPENKIKAYLMCSKLRAAYLLAVKLDPVKACLLVQDVLQVAEGSTDTVMRDICRQWLSEHQKPASRQHHGNNR